MLNWKSYISTDGLFIISSYSGMFLGTFKFECPPISLILGFGRFADYSLKKLVTKVEVDGVDDFSYESVSVSALSKGSFLACEGLPPSPSP